VPEKWLRLYDAEKLTLRPNVSFPAVETASSRITEEALRLAMQGYYAHISALDFQFGRILDALKSSGQLDDTLVVYTSDHGDLLGSQGWMNKQMPYDEAVRVPLLFGQHGRIAPGKRGQFIGLADLAPTLLGAVGLGFPEETEGSDFHALLQNPDAPTRSDIYLADYTACHQSAFRNTPAWRAIRTARHLFACLADGTPWLLFDSVEDPFQRHNLLAGNGSADLRKSLFNRLDALVRKHDAWLPPEDLICQLGLRENWNESQKYFDLPQINRAPD
jgi:arylsulfatase A-like enzyme